MSTTTTKTTTKTAKAAAAANGAAPPAPQPTAPPAPQPTAPAPPTPKTDSVKALQQFSNDWGYLYGASTLAGCCGGDDRNGKFLAINHTAIPCRPTELGDKAAAIGLTLLRAHSAGYGVAPYARNMKKGAETKKLFEMVPPSVDAPDTAASTMRMWSYEKKSMARGPRCDDISFELGPGDTFTFFVSPQTFENMKMDDPENASNALPVDVESIPEFSLLEITVSPKSRDSCLAGSGFRICTVRMLSRNNLSLYSLMATDLQALPKSLAAYTRATQAKRENFPMLARDLEDSKAAFLLDACPCTSFVNDDNLTAGTSNMVQLVVGNGVLDEGEFIDVPVDILCRYTNTQDVRHACALVECAAALGALRVFVAHNSYWGRKGASRYRGVPLVDTGAFFSAVAAMDPAPVAAALLENANGTVTAATGKEYDSMLVDLEICAQPGAVDAADAKPVPCPDLTLVGPGFSLQRAYKVFVNLRAGDAASGEDDVRGVFVGYFNVSSPGASVMSNWGNSSRFKRRKLVSMC